MIRCLCAIWLVCLSWVQAQDSVVVFNEIHYHPPAEETEWIELHNQMAVDVDISGWRLRGGIKYDFPADTVIGGGDYLIIAADPAGVKVPFIDVLGPFEGKLNNGGDTLRLEDRSTLGTVVGGEPRYRVMDRLSYDETMKTDGTGFTLAKIDPDGGTEPLWNWLASHNVGGTPGRANFPPGTVPSIPENGQLGPIVINEIMYRQRPAHAKPAVPGEFAHDELVGLNTPWKFDASGLAPLVDWESGAIDWPTGNAPFGVGLDTPAVTIRTPLSLSYGNVPFVATYYFRKTFQFTGDPASYHDLALNLYVDDGAAVYLNGTEIYRVNLPEGQLTNRTSALDAVSTLEWINVPDIDPNLLQPGDNVLAVELHQQFTLFTKSDDAAFAAEFVARRATNPPVGAQPHRESGEEWIELYNRSDRLVDLSGWRLEDKTFDDGTTLAAGAYLVVDSLKGTLSNGGESILLRDAEGNVVDEVYYRDNGRWPKSADGYGSSLELRNPHADNAVAEAWAPSDESTHSEWITYSYEGVAENDGIGTSLYHEIVIGMLDTGEILLDDVSVIENPDGSAIELMQNGDFEQGDLDAMPDHWLAVGTHGEHGRTRLVEDPDSPGNKVLHLMTTGAAEDKHNQLSSVYDNNERVQLGRTYRISFRAKWLSGSNQLNTRLYFNYLQRTTRLTVPDSGGTPGQRNSTFSPDIGPTLDHLTQTPVLPTADQSVDVRIRVADPDGIDTVKLTYAINGGTLFSGGTHVVDMEAESNGIYKGTVPKRKVGDVIRIHVSATDTLGNVTHYPRQGADARAMYEVIDDPTLDDGPHRLRVLMEKKDREYLFQDAVRMSNDRILGTVIYKDIVYYNVGIRLKGSAWARNNTPFQGLNIRFDSEKPFRGVHETIAMERDPGKGEIMAHHLFYAAGGKLPAYYNDIVQLDFDQASFSGRVLLLMARTSGPFLRGTFDNASEGTVYNLELLYTPNGTIGGPETAKRPFPYNHTNGRYDFRIMGPDKEAYRWGFQIRSNRDRDNYEPVLRAAEAFHLEGSRLETAAETALDVDQWARAFAMMALNGNDDFYSRIWEHNLRLYHRPDDDRLLAVPWDFDRAWRLSSSSPLIGERNGDGDPVNLSKLFEGSVNRRLLHSHLHDLLDSVYNTDYVDSWAKHYGALFRSSLSSVTSYVRTRSSFVRRQLPDEIPFIITTNGGMDFTIDRTFVPLTGRGWINVHEIRLEGLPAPLPLEWRGSENWRTTIPVNEGTHPVTIVAYDMRGNEVGSASITVTSTANEVLASAKNMMVSEIHYHPADQTASETAAGFDDADAFEFLELWNVSNNVSVELNGLHFTSGIRFEFAETVLEPGERAVLVADRLAFAQRYGDQVRVLGEYNGQLRNSGERVLLIAANGSVIADIDYDDEAPWPIVADGDGPSLSFSGIPGESLPDDPQHWAASVMSGGDPGVSTGAADITYAMWKEANGLTDDAADLDGDGISNFLEYAFGSDPRDPSSCRLPALDASTRLLAIPVRPGALDVQRTLEASSNLKTWGAGKTFRLVRSEGDMLFYQEEADASTRERYIRVKVER